MHNKKITIVLALCFSAAFSSFGLAQEVETEGPDRIAECQAYSWFDHEKIPVFDPLLSGGSVEKKMLIEDLDAVIRQQVEQQLSKKSWSISDDESVTCRVRYAMIHELDLETAYESQGAPPTSTDGFGESLGGGPNSNLKRQGTLTVEFLPPDSEDWIWRGTATRKLGQEKDLKRNIERLTKKLMDKAPRPGN